MCSEYSEHYFRDYQSVIPKSTYSIAWSYYNLLHSHWLAIWCIFRRSPLSEENYPNRNPAWKQALLIIDFQENTRKGSSTFLSEPRSLVESFNPWFGRAESGNQIQFSYLLWDRNFVLTQTWRYWKHWGFRIIRDSKPAFGIFRTIPQFRKSKSRGHLFNVNIVKIRLAAWFFCF